MRIRLLGPLQVIDADGRPVELGGARLRTLLAALALVADRPVPTSTLIDALWPEDDQPANPGNALQALVSRLRTAVGRELVVATPVGYRLALDPAAIDARRFEQLLVRPTPEQLTQALALWRGPALVDLPGFPEDAARLDALCANAREDLLELRVSERSISEGPISAGQTSVLIGELQELSAAAPLRDRPRALLIRALHQAGRSAEALAVFEQGRELLAEELGVDPSRLLRDAQLAALGAGTAAPAPPTAPISAEAGAESRADSRADARADAGTATDRAGLPAPTTSFLGREADLAAVRAALDAARLVTLTGPGGAGKTRLALRAAETTEGIQVRLVELAPVTDPADLPSTVLATLQLRESAAPRPALLPHLAPEATERIVSALGARPMLLVLDNCEHLVEAAAVLTARLLAGCPGLRILATSREPLGIGGEQLHPVPPLAFPADPRADRTLTPEQALDFAAVRLFRDRAAAVRPGYSAGPDDLPAVLRICRALDGQPLAIELAAARMHSFTPEQIDQRLSRRFHLLTGGSRAALPRQRTLRAVVDWSWDLLEKPERSLLARMSVFAGGAELETVEQVCASDPDDGRADGLCTDDVMDALASLVDKSLVVRTPSGRYRLLETIRVYAAEKLDEGGTADATRDAHARHFLALAEEGEPWLYRTGQVAWLARFKADHENLIGALRRSVEQGDADTSQRLVAALGWYLWRRGERGENLPLVHQALALPGAGVSLRSRAVAHGITALYSLDTTWELPSTLALMRTAIELRDRMDDPHAHPLLSMLDIMSSMFEAKDWRIGGMAVDLFEARDPWVRAISRMFMGYALQNDGRADEAERYMLDASERFREVGDLWGQSFCAAGLADYAQWRGDVPEAVRLWELAIEHERRLGVNADSGDYRARMLSVRTAGLTIDAATLAELEEEAATALREGTWSVVTATHTALAEAYRRLGRPEDSRTVIAAATELVGGTIQGAPQIHALLLSSAGYVEAACGALDAAAGLHRSALTAAASAFDGPIVAICLQGWADLELRSGDPDRAAELLGAAHTQRGLQDRSSADVLRISAAAAEALGPDGFARAYARGRATTYQELLGSLGVTAPPRPDLDA